MAPRGLASCYSVQTSAAAAQDTVAVRMRAQIHSRLLLDLAREQGGVRPSACVRRYVRSRTSSNHTSPDGMPALPPLWSSNHETRAHKPYKTVSNDANSFFRAVLALAQLRGKACECT